MSTKTCVIVAGPTASGKTALALQLARHFNTAIISADSRQCYREMNIGVARPAAAELAMAPHYFISTHTVEEEVNAAVFEQYALQAATEIFQQHDTVIMAGGTGLYIRAFCGGMDNIPPIPETIKQLLAQQYEAGGMEWLQQQVEKHDPLYWKNGETRNPHRLLRALEVKLATGRSIRSFQSGGVTERPFRTIKLGLNPPRKLLYELINERVLQMMEAGLLEEARLLFPRRHLKALQTVGYAELFDFMEGKHSLPRAVELIQQNTRRYAKRQITWFSKEPDMHWLPEPTPEAALAVILNLQNHMKAGG